MHDPAIRGSHTPLSNHWFGFPMILGSPTRSGRRVLLMPVKVLMPVTMLIGLPLWAWVITPICQPSANRLPLKGSS